MLPIDYIFCSHQIYFKGYIIKTLIFVSVLFSSHFAFSNEAIILNRADLNFDNHIRVQMPAKIVEAPDASLIGKESPYIQSLSYTASKSIQLSNNFSSTQEVNTFINDELCNELHEVTLKPIRESGSKGINSFIAKMKARIITVHGLIVAEKNKPFSLSLICKSKVEK